MSSSNPSRNTFLTQLMSINIRSKEFPNLLTEMLASIEGVNTAMSLQGDDALTLVDILDQAFEAQNMTLDLRKRSDRILRRVCGLQMILPRSCLISDGISKEGDVAFASGGFADVWKGRYNGNPVCVKAFRNYTAQNLAKIKQRLFHDFVIWRRLSHPNVLPMLGVSPKLFPLCIVSEWMIDGNIMDFTSKHPEVNRLRLLAEVASGLRYLHSMEIIHSDLKPANILIDRNFRPCLTDYGLVAIISDPNTVDPGSTTTPSVGTVRYMAPELLNPAGFGLDTNHPTKKSDVYAFGVVTYQVITGQLPYPGAKDGVIIYNVVSGERPGRPEDAIEWLSDDVWSLISQCWSASWDGRPDVDFAINALNDAADAAGAGKRKAYTTNDQGQGTTRRDCVSRSVPSRELPRRRVSNAPIPEALQPPPPPRKASAAPSPFVVRKPASSKAGEKERKRLREKGFRTWHDSTGFHRQEAALVGYKDGVVHLSSSDGARLEIPEVKLAQEDITYLRAQDGCEKSQPKRQGFIYRMLQRKNSLPGIGAIVSATIIYRNLTRSEAIILRLIFGKKGGANHVAQHRLPPKSQLDTRDDPLQPHQISTSSASQTKSWEADLNDFLRVCKTGVRNDGERKRAQEFVDGLDMALVGGDLPQQKRRNFLRHLRKLCGSFNILPSSFLIQPTFDEFATEPSAFGRFSNVFEATLKGRRVAVKTIRAANTGNLDRVHKLIVKEVVGWKWLQHENILPFIGVALTPPLFSTISEWMENGDITYFTRTHPDYNRLRLANTVMGLEYLHGHGIVHGYLKGANILIGPDRRALLAGFGLTSVIDESAAGSVVDDNGMRGTLRWMAPELMHPEKFGFTKECPIRLPSRGADIYALGMTILEVVTGNRPFNSIAAEPAVMYKVLEGCRPDRPQSCFTDQLWELLMKTWLVEHGSQPQKRPQTSTIRDLLNEEVENWGVLIVPPLVVENAVDGTADNDMMATVAYPARPDPPPPDTDLREKDGANEIARHHSLIDSQQDMRDDALKPHQTSKGPTTQTEPWEADLENFLRVCNPGVKNDLEGKKAQGFADGLDMVLVGGDLPQRKRRDYLRHLRRLCGSFNILPSSFLVQPTFDEFATEPFAFGGFANLFEATFEGRRVAVKRLRAANTGKLERAHRLLVEEVVGWKWLQHKNILPFIGVALTPPFVSIISEWMGNGDITRFTRAHPNYNRIRLLADTVTGLEYLHEHSIVHGDLKGANILIGPDCRAMLADFGLTAVIDESAAGSVIDNNGLRGTLRWMAPELMYPDGFGFTKECQIRLPSRGTDMYALGMTILEVITGCRPYNDIAAEGAVMCKVLKGGKPNRPPSGFTDQLWELLAKTWLVEHGSQPPKRPQTSTIRNQLNEEVNNWGTLIVPPPVAEHGG